MKFPFFSKKDSKKDLYLGLFLKEKEGLVLILSKKANKLELLEKKKFFYTNNWDNLTNDLDEAIFELEKKLNIEINKTIFFLYSYFIDEKSKELKKIYLNKIKEVVENLGLSPLGYIECIEAVSSFLSEREQTPLTAIIIELDAAYLSVFIYKGGRLTFKKTIPRSDSINEDLNLIFNELKGRFLFPSRIIIYNSKDLDHISSQILTYRWSEEYFFQLPKVEVLKEEELVRSLIKIFDKQIKDFPPNLPYDDDKRKKVAQEEVMGFMIGKDIQEEKLKETINLKKQFLLKDMVLKLIKRLHFSQLYFIFSQKFLFFAVLLLIISGLLISEIFFHTASLTLYVPSLKIERQLNLFMPYRVATISAEFSYTKNTTGEREIGEKAHGEVIVYNTNLKREKLIEKGKEIETEGLKFTFDEEIKVSTAASATNPGKIKTSVTALKIGAEYNIAKGKRFNIDETTYAEAVTDFTGGSKSKIQTISQKDIEDLKILIIEKAKNDKKFSQKENTYGLMLPQLSKFDLVDVNVSGEVGEESPTVTLKAKVNKINYFLSRNDLEKEIFTNVVSLVPNGYALSKNLLSFQIASASAQEDLVNVELKVRAKAIKKIDKNEVLNKVVGLNKSLLEGTLKKELQIDNYDFKIESALPFLKDFFPFRLKNINLTVSSL